MALEVVVSCPKPGCRYASPETSLADRMLEAIAENDAIRLPQMIRAQGDELMLKVDLLDVRCSGARSWSDAHIVADLDRRKTNWLLTAQISSKRTFCFRRLLWRIATSSLVFWLTMSCCYGQSKPFASPAPELHHLIEITLRSEFNLPADCDITIGASAPSDYPGFLKLPVEIKRDQETAVIEFLLSTDGKTLARLEKFDLTANPALNINVDDRPVRGDPEGRVSVIVFDDLECPFCAQMHERIFPSTLQTYKKGVRFVYKDYPLVEAHPWAMRAAIDANCLASQNGDAYWAFVDYIHLHLNEVNGEQHDLARSAETLDLIAKTEGTNAKLDHAKLDRCIQEQDESNVRKSIREGNLLRVDGTPAIFVNGERVNGGAVPTKQLWSVIDRALRESEQSIPKPIAGPTGRTP